MTDIMALLASYPRTRPALPPASARIYAQEYKINRGGSSNPLYRITAALEAWMHRRVAAGAHGRHVLEIGAGPLNHRDYEPKNITYDIIEPFKALYEGRPELAATSHIYASIHEVPLRRGYDRIFSIAVLEHLENLPDTVAASAARLARGGIFQAGIPAEGGFTWGLAWRCTTAISYRLRTGLSYAPVMRHEHINNADEIIAIVRHYFHDVRLRWFPLPTKHLAFYGFIEARDPKSIKGSS